MALGETMSGSNDWFQIYQQNFPAAQVVASSVSDAVAVSTAASASTTQGSSPANTSGANVVVVNHSLTSPEGKIAKPVRRRSRASRRTPTTLLNTDTTNFRAMVQQFTGDPSAPFSVSRMPSLGFGVGAAHQAPVNPSSAVMVTPSFHLQQQQQLYQQQNHQQQQQQQNQYMLSMNNNSNMNHGTGRVDFYQRISNPNPTTSTARPSNNESSMTNHGFVTEEHGGGGGRFFPSSSSS